MENRIYLIGLNHRTAGVEVREKYALTNTENFEQATLANCPVRECMALSTCNRVEITVVAADGMAEHEVTDAVISHWAAACGGAAEELVEHVYRHRGLDAVKHTFTVACSLDSMIMGEPQILGQLKDAYRASLDSGTAGVVVNRLLHKAFSVAKRVRTETAIASSAVSISYAAVELAKRIFGDLGETRAMLVGAGEMAELAATHLLNNGVQDIIIANRTLARAQELSERMGGTPIAMEKMFDHLQNVDIIISSTGSPSSVIRAKDVKNVLKKRRNSPMFFIDIAVPRDIDPDVNTLDNVYLYDIDDLKEVVEENTSRRQEEAVKAHSMVEGETDAFGTWLNSLALNPTIVDLVDRSEEIARRELAKTLKRLGPVDAETHEALETLVLSVGRKVLHEPICFLKRRTREEGVADRFIDMARRMFHLDNEKIPANAHMNRRRPDDSCSPDDIESFIESTRKDQ